MATQLPMTLQDIQDSIHTLTSSDATTPLPTDDLWTVRLNLINRAVSRWERQDVNWKELFATYIHATPIALNTAQYAIAATDFRRPGSLLRITLNGSLRYIDIVPAEDMVKYQGSGQVAYFTGNAKDGFTLNLGWIPAAGDQLLGATLSFDYYKSADRLAAPADTTRMSNPDYIVFWAAAQELLFNGRTNLSQNYLSEADDCMDTMRIQNAMVPAYASNALQDIDVVRDNDFWGE